MYCTVLQYLALPQDSVKYPCVTTQYAQSWANSTVVYSEHQGPVVCMDNTWPWDSQHRQRIPPYEFGTSTAVPVLYALSINLSESTSPTKKKGRAIPVCRSPRFPASSSSSPCPFRLQSTSRRIGSLAACRRVIVTSSVILPLQPLSLQSPNNFSRQLKQLKQLKQLFWLSICPPP